MNDIARFQPDDPGPLVTASFACPFCLRGPAFVWLSDLDEDLGGTCVCVGCSVEWEVAMSPAQMLRLTLAAPSELPVERPGSVYPPFEA
jgi:hypothetical protein